MTTDSDMITRQELHDSLDRLGYHNNILNASEVFHDIQRHREMESEPDADVRASLGAAIADPYAPESVHTVAERVHELKPGVSVLHASWAVVALRAMGWKPPEETAAAPRQRLGDQPPPVPTGDPSCPDCGGEVVFDLACHTYPQRRSDGTEQWMSCLSCDSAIRYICVAAIDDTCGWPGYTHGLNPRNPRSAANEAHRPPWLPEAPSIGVTQGAVPHPGIRMIGKD